MPGIKDRFVALYNDFNTRNIDAVIAKMSASVKWANGMEGGFVSGHDGVREYWKRQFAIVSSQVTPLEITSVGDEVHGKVHQVVHDTGGNLLADQIVMHRFTLSDGEISEFNIAEAEKKP